MIEVCLRFYRYTAFVIDTLATHRNTPYTTAHSLHHNPTQFDTLKEKPRPHAPPAPARPRFELTAPVPYGCLWRNLPTYLPTTVEACFNLSLLV